MIKSVLLSKLGDTGHLVKCWATFSVKDNIGDALDMTGLKDASIQIDGNFGTGKLVLMGSNNKQEFYPLYDRNGYPISFTKPGIYHLDVHVAHLYPAAVNPDEDTALVATLCARRTA